MTQMPEPPPLDLDNLVPPPDDFDYEYDILFAPESYDGVENTYAESGTPMGLLEKYGLMGSNVAAAAKRAVSNAT